MSNATYILKSDTIFTSNSDKPKPGAVVIEDNRIVDVVGKAQVDKYVDENTKVYDFGDKLIMPGIVDPHIHFFMASIAASEHMCTDIIESTSEEDCIRIIKEYADTHPDEEQIFGMGWFPANWNDAPLPTKESLDAAFPDKPVYLIAADVHTAWLNTPALEKCGIKPDDVVHNGEIGVDENGELNGLLFEMDAMIPVIIQLYGMEKNKLKNVYVEFCNYVSSLGITSISDMTSNDYTDTNYNCYKIIKEIENNGDMTVRMHIYPRLDGITDFSDADKLKSEFHSDVLQIAGVKGFVDGVMSTYTGYLLEPYSDRTDTTGEGAPVTPIDEMQEYVVAANAAGYPVRLHCIGDAAVRMGLDMYETSNSRNPGHGLNNTIEHVEIIHPDDIPRFNELGVIPSMQPAHLILERNEKFERAGMERSKTAWAHKSILDSGAKLAFGTDYPVVDINPFPSIYAAVTRCDENGAELGNNPWEKVSLSEALISYTKFAAEAYNRGSDFGTLEAGKFADICVVDRNLFDVEYEEISNAKPVMTMMDGKIVFKDESIDK